MTVALLPIRSLRDGKRRLSPMFPPSVREAVVRQLFQRTHAALLASDDVTHISVVSPDPEVLRWVEPLGVLPVLQADAGLNNGLEQARRELVAQQRWTTLLVLLPDLPLLASSDIQKLLRLKESRSLVLAPDRHGAGTNGLVLQLTDELPFVFGDNSFHQFQKVATAQGLTIQLYQSLHTTLDLDTADDLQLIREYDPQFAAELLAGVQSLPTT